MPRYPADIGRSAAPLVAVGHQHTDLGDQLPGGGSGQAAPGAPGLWFLGYRTAIEGNLRQHPVEAGRIAHAVARARSSGDHGRLDRPGHNSVEVGVR